MVASFLTSNLTVGFILGALFNAPLAFAGSIRRFDHRRTARAAGVIKRWSISEQFRDFSGGVISLASIGYFLAIVVVMLYLSMVLIGRRHWRGGAEGSSVAGHYSRAVPGAGRGRRRGSTCSCRITTGCASTSPASGSARCRRKAASLLAKLDTKRPVRDRRLRQPQRARELRADAAEPALDAARAAGRRRRQDPGASATTSSPSARRPRWPSSSSASAPRRSSRGPAAPAAAKRSSWAWPSPAGWTRS